MSDPQLDAQSERMKAEASAWFRTLRDRICAAFEDLETRATPGDGPFEGETAPRDLAPGRFELRETVRDPGPQGLNGGGGLMSVMRGGRVFEKVGVNWSAVHGVLSPASQRAMTSRGVPGLEADPRFWASGISLVAHMRNPRAPAVHMNTRMFWTPGASWFGGGADLNPCIEFGEDTAHFHAEMQRACDAHDAGHYPRFKAWADEYFFIPHRGRARGVGGIFYDDLQSGDREADFAFTRAVGEAFLPAFLPLAEARHSQAFTRAEREQQLVHRGLYAEYNLVYDRGTKFGLETGHDADAVLMSLPPVAKWT